MLASLGFGELILAAVLALVLFGPDKGIRLAHQAGKIFSRIRNEWNNIEKSIDDSKSEK